MDAAKQREIASKGGRSVAPEDRSFSQNRRLAAEAGRKGGQASHGGNRARTKRSGADEPAQRTQERAQPMERADEARDRDEDTAPEGQRGTTPESGSTYAGNNASR